MNIQSASLSAQLPKATAAAPRQTKEISYNPQDTVVMQPGTTTIEVSPEASTDKLRLKGGLIPNEEGQFVYPKSDPRFHGANALAAVSKTLNLFEKAYGQSVRWATGRDQLDIHPDNGQTLNAFYSRKDKGLFFFHSTDPVTQQVVHGADSGEVTSHEGGHAILDAIRPGYMSSWSGDAGGFHESFGDVMAMLTSMQDPRVLQEVANQTGGDLRKPNLLAALGEELGITINHTAGKNATGGDYTRNAINDFVWQKPSSLPHNAPPDKLSSEPHSWSRLWTGAVYDILEQLTQERMQESPDMVSALAGARDELTEMYGRLMRHAPKGGFSYKQMAAAFLQSDLEENDGKRAGMLGKVFARRKILGDESGMVATDFRQHLAGEGTRQVEVELRGDRFGQFNGARVVTEESGQKSEFRVDQEASDSLKDRMAQLIDAGRILYTEPNSNPSTAQLFRPDGKPYEGVVRWVDGQMTIERVLIAS